jgi:pterin-4a-carbinolamine dehydratase
MKQLTLNYIKTYVAKPLGEDIHLSLSKKLRYFKPNPSFTQLEYRYFFDPKKSSALYEKMNRIGWIADEIDHHPEWTITESSLHIKLSTHDIGNKISVKDYWLGVWAE